MVSLKIDVHTHTVYSDGRGTVREVLKIAKLKGLNGLAITDHDSLRGYFEAKLYDSGLLVIPGYEVDTDAGHVLVLGLEFLPSETEHIRYESLIEWVRRANGLTILAHPAAGKTSINRWMRCKPDAIEVLNALYPLYGYFVRRSLNIASKLGVPMVGGSDAHNPQSVGDSYTIVKSDNLSFEDLIEAFKRGDVYFGGGLSPLSSRLKTGLEYMVSAVVSRVGEGSKWHTTMKS